MAVCYYCVCLSVCVTSQEQVGQHSALMVKGMLGLLNTCPQEVAHLRKEMLIAARHILATDLRKCEYPHQGWVFTGLNRFST